MARLICTYCGNTINRSNRKCPQCGAETESSIKKFLEAREVENENNKALLKKLTSARRKRVIAIVIASLALVILSVLLFQSNAAFTVKALIFLVLAAAYVVCLVIGIKDILKTNAECDELDDRIGGIARNIIFECEEVQPYKMISDSENVTNEGCFREGLQQIAFKVSITNVHNRSINFQLTDEFFAKTDDFGNHVRLNADGVRMEDCKLVPFFSHHEENNKVFEPPLYKDGFQKIVLRPQESIVGWIAFYVTPDAKDLELLFADNYVMIKNPMHKEE